MDILAINATHASIEFLQKGGVFMYPLILCSIAALTAIAFKALSLASDRTLPPKLLKNLEAVSTVDSSTYTQEIKEGKSSLARLAQVILSNQGKSSDEVTRNVESSARIEVMKLNAGIGVLDVIITVAPLLGLLGTASGLVTIFQGLGETTDHLAIARGIAQALNTTIFGLAIAVPCVIAHSYFSRKIEHITARMETSLTNFLSAISSLEKTSR